MKRKVILFVILAFAIDWVAWLVTVSVAGPITDGIDAGAWTLVAPLSMFGPLVAALAVRLLPGDDVDGGWRPRIRGNVRLYLMAWFAPAALSVLGAIVYFLVFPSDFDPTAQPFVDAVRSQMDVGSDMVPMLFVVQVLASILLNPLLSMFVAIGEEAGWRGFLFPALETLMPANRAAVVTGIVWGVWHAPLIAMGYNYGTAYPGFPVAGIAMMVAACTAIGMLLCYVRERSGSVWPSALGHGALNATASLSLYVSIGGTTIMGPSPLGLIGFLPAAALGIWCWRQLGRPRREASSQAMS